MRAIPVSDAAKSALQAGQLKSLVGSVLPSGTAVDVRPVADHCAALFPAEMDAVARAVRGRRREFSTGRASARAAMTSLGFPKQILPVGTQREPIWPAGLIGSITHGEGLCIAVVRRADGIVGMGIDLTSRSPLDQDLRRLICTPVERQQIEQFAIDLPVDPYKLIFSAKEALFKALFPLVRRFVDFQEAQLTLNITNQAWRASLTGHLATIRAEWGGRLLMTDSVVVTTAVARRT